MPRIQSLWISIRVYIYLLGIVFLSVIIMGCSSFDPSELKGYYKPLVVSQYSLNKEDKENQEQYVQAIIDGKDASLKYYFEIDSKVFYILKDVVYTKEGIKNSVLQPKSEGYFTDKAYLYYVYGNEKEKTSYTLGGPVHYTLKDYKYCKLDLSTNKEIEVEKEEYETLYDDRSQIIYEYESPEIWVSS